MSESTNQIWEQFGEKLRVFILKRVRIKQDAEDILQDVFLKIHDKIQSLKIDDKLESWIYQITRNTIIDYYRNKSKKKKLEIELPEDFEEYSENKDFERLETEIASCIKPIIDDLPEKYRSAIMMTEFESLSQKDLAKKLGLTISGAKSRVQRARIKLKEVLLACCHFEFDSLGKVNDYKPKGKFCRYCPDK